MDHSPATDIAAAEAAVAEWNRTVPNGTPVRYRNDALPNYVTAGAAYVTPAGAARVPVDGTTPMGGLDGPAFISDLHPMPGWRVG